MSIKNQNRLVISVLVSGILICGILALLSYSQNRLLTGGIKEAKTATNQLQQELEQLENDPVLKATIENMRTRSMEEAAENVGLGVPRPTRIVTEREIKRQKKKGNE